MGTSCSMLPPTCRPGLSCCWRCSGRGSSAASFPPCLARFPDALLILVSGLSGTRETAQQQVLIGMGLLAGFTIMLMAVLWGSCLVVGKVGLSESSSPSQHSWIGTGVATDQQTSYAVRIMVISIIPFVIVQVIDPLIQNRRIGYAKHKHI